MKSDTTNGYQDNKKIIKESLFNCLKKKPILFVMQICELDNIVRVAIVLRFL